MLEYDFESSSGHWICMTSHLYTRAINEELAPRGITYRQWQVLGCLSVFGESSQVELADHMNIEPASLVPVLDRMERDGLIARVSCPTDRRKKLIKPLEKAEVLWKQIVESAERVRVRATAGMSESQLASLRELLDQVQQNLSRETVAATA